MNVQLKKEVRSLAPAFVVPVLAIATLAYFFQEHGAVIFVLVVFVGVCALLGASSFGNEFDARTMLLLLSQPVSRRRLWMEKMRLLAVALILAYAVTLFCVLILCRADTDPAAWGDFAAIMLLTVLAAFTAAPFLSLATKNLVSATAFTALLPLGLAGTFFFCCWAAAQFTSHPDAPFLNAEFENHPYWSIGIPAAIYCAVCYWFGYRTFLSFEAVDSQSQELKLPAVVEGTLGRWSHRVLPRYTGPCASLIRKELRIHRISYLIAAVLCVLLIGEGIMVKVHNSPANTVMIGLEFVLLVFCVPILVGVASLAEERSWGTLPGQLTLPISPFKQWRLKMLITYATAILLGVILPATLFFVGTKFLGSPFDVNDRVGNNPEETYTFLTLSYLTIFTLIVFASSVSANSLRAIIFSVGLMIAIAAIIGTTAYVFSEMFPPTTIVIRHGHAMVSQLIQSNADVFQIPPRLLLDLFFDMSTGLAMAVLATVAGWMAFFNFRNGELNPARTRLQTVVLLLCLAGPTIILTWVARLAANATLLDAVHP